MSGAGIDLEVEIYSTKLANETSPSPEDGNRSSFRNVVFLFSNSSEPGRWTKSENPLILCVIHHRQNPTESTNHYTRLSVQCDSLTIYIYIYTHLTLFATSSGTCPSATIPDICSMLL
jgi:hypothetical protein